jgi:purine-binding chemotaxis protein CheW
VTGGDTLRLLTFRMDQRLYALPAEDISEVIRIPAAARVPRSPAALLGLASHRGSVIPLASLRGLLGVAEAGAFSTSRAIVLSDGAPVAIAVDSVDALVAIPAGSVETRQSELAAESGERLKGTFRSDALVAKVLDIQSLLESAFVRRPKPQRQIQTHTTTTKGEAAENRDAEMLVTFDVADQEYALELADVREIVSRPASVTTVARAEALVVGMMAFRDQLLPLLSLRGLLGFASSSVASGREKILVAKVGGALVGLIADRVRAILSAERDRIDPMPSLLAARTGGEAKIKAIYRGEAGRRLISILATEQLFREDVMQRVTAAHRSVTSHAAKTDHAPGRELKFLVFRLAGDEFGLPIEAVDEVMRVPAQVTRVPKTPGFLEGVVNLRGDVLPIVDQRRRFEMPKLEETKKRRLIVVRTGSHRAGLIVDSVSEVLSSSTDAIKAPPSLTDETARLICGVINLEQHGRIVVVLDPSELLTPSERGALDTFAPAPELAVS